MRTPSEYLAIGKTAVKCSILERVTAEAAELAKEVDRRGNKIEMLLDELEVAAKQAQRYLQLRANARYEVEDIDGPQLVFRNGETGPFVAMRPVDPETWLDELDGAIDAERIGQRAT